MTFKRRLRAVLLLAASISVVLGLGAIPMASADPCTVAVTLVGGTVKTVPIDATPGMIPTLGIHLDQLIGGPGDGV